MINKISNILLEGLELYSVEVLLKVDFDYNKVEIYNHIRALTGVVMMKVEVNSYLRQISNDKYEFALVHIKYISITNPQQDIDSIKNDALNVAKIPGLLQFIPRYKTIIKKAHY